MCDWYDLNVNYTTPWQANQSHFHSKMEIVLVLEGGGNFNIDGNVYQAVPGTLLLVSGGVLHLREESLNSRDYCRHLLHYPASLLTELSTPQTDFLSVLEDVSGSFYPDAAQRQALDSQFLRCVSAAPHSFGEDIRRQTAFSQLLLLICEIVNANCCAGVLQADGYEKFAPILAYIDAHLSEQLTTEHLAKQFFFSKNYISQNLKKHIGMSLSNYVKYRRIQHARVLLRAGSNIQQVSEDLGFTSDTYFIKSFRESVGITPGQYRQLYRNRSQRSSFDS